MRATKAAAPGKAAGSVAFNDFDGAIATAHGLTLGNPFAVGVLQASNGSYFLTNLDAIPNFPGMRGGTLSLELKEGWKVTDVEPLSPDLKAIVSGTSLLDFRS